jgi:hypothetical protein
MTGVFGTATVAADRLIVTLDYMGTRVAQVDQQNLNLQATLIARGTSPAAIGGIDPNNVTLIPTSEAATNNGQAGDLSQSQAAVVITPAAPTPASTTPTLSNMVLSNGVGSDDCAVGSMTSFTATDPEIYVVATAFNIQPGTTIAARWQVGGQEILHDFTPDFEINGNCVWFFIDQTDTTFVAGNWNVQLEINGSPIGSPLQFSITG